MILFVRFSSYDMNNKTTIKIKKIIIVTFLISRILYLKSEVPRISHVSGSF